MAMAAIGIIASIIGTFFVRSKESASQKELLFALRKGVYISADHHRGGTSFLWSRSVLGPERIGVYFAILSGLVAGIIIGYYTEYIDK